jgi:hypothetical protein
MIEMKRRDRITAIVASGVLIALATAVVVTGASPGGSRSVLSDIGAWLSNADGSVTHANGLTGTVDGAVALAGAAGHQLEVTQDAGTVVVVDQSTGLVSRIDPAQVAVGQSQDYGHADVTFVAGPDAAYIQVASKGLVQQVDPTTLSLVGQPLSLPAPTGRAGIDKRGTLWVPLPEQGTAMPVVNGNAGEPVSVGAPKDPLVLTMAGGTPVVTNARSGVVTVIDPEGDQVTVNLPPAVKNTVVRTPKATDGATVPVLGSGVLALVDTASGTVTALPLAKRSRLGEPQALGTYVYVPDENKGSLIVFNTSTGQFEDDIVVTGRRGKMTVLVKDGLLWASDQNSNSAVVIGPDKTVHQVTKQVTPSGTQGTPSGQPSPPEHTQDPPRQPENPPRQPENPPDSPTAPKTSKPAVTQDPPAQPDPQAPGTVTATSGAGLITVGFVPAAGASSYTLVGAPAGAKVAPAQVPAQGEPFQFVVRGGDCAKSYSFKVVAHYPGDAPESTASVAVRPCVPPGSPRGVAAKAVEHGAKLSWSAPAELGADHVGYKVFYNNGKSRDTGFIGATTASITGLTNFQTYQFEVEAANESGTSRRVRTSAALTGPTLQAQVYGTSVGQPDVRSAPDTNPNSIVGAAGAGETVTVICQVKGEWVSGGDIWDKIKWSGPTGFIHDLYLNTPNSPAKTFSDPPLWNCQ